jgi:hypothetical protein
VTSIDTADPRHGTENAYNNLRCRCDRCRQAWAKAVAERRERRISRPIPAHVHGSVNGYTNYRCRCRACTYEYSNAYLVRKQRRERESA